MRVKTACPPTRPQGFSLLEVLIALLVVSLGLIGMSKMQAASLSNSQIARTRALIAIQASSLAGAMHGNRGFWSSTAVSVTAVGAKVTDTKTGILSVPADCSPKAAAPCSPSELAAYDLQAWAANLNTRFPSYSAAIECTNAAPGSCVISLSWEEKYVAINRTTAKANGATQTASPTQYSLYVEP